MNEALKNENSVREYLLGRVSDEQTLAEYEELLFLDEEFCALAGLVEDELINDYALENLSEKDREDFEKTLFNNSERRAKVALAGAIRQKALAQKASEKARRNPFFESLGAFFRKPLNAVALAVLLIGVAVAAFFVLNHQKTDEIVELKAVYKQERPTEARLSGFDYAPLQTTRGAAEEREKSRLRRIQNSLLEAVEKNPSAENSHALGVFYLTQGAFAEAVENLEKAARADAKNASVLNDLGSAYFEKALSEGREKNFETLNRALENFSRAAAANPQFLPAQFNKSLCLQELGLYNQAKESWNSYLEKDPDSGWAVEARRNLERLEGLRQSSKTKAQVLTDFLAADRARDDEKAFKIVSQTREMLSGVWLADQLTRRFLESKIRGDDLAASESMGLLKKIGVLEKSRNADFFVADLAGIYADLDNSKAAALLKGKESLSEGFRLTPEGDFQTALAHFKTAKRAFEQGGNFLEEQIAEYWIAFCLAELADLNASAARLENLEKTSLSKNYKWLGMIARTRLGDIAFRQNDLSKAIETTRSALALSEALADTMYQQRNAAMLAFYYDTLGENEKALSFLSKLFAAKDLYFQGYYQKLRNLGAFFDKLKFLDLTGGALEFALEYQKTVAENSTDTALLFDAESVLIELFYKKGDLDSAETSLSKCRELLEKIADERSKQIKLAYLDLLQANLNLKRENYETALSGYEAVVARLAGIDEYVPDLFTAHKGRLICLDKLARRADFEDELRIVSELFEKYRTQILEEEARNSFFDREQSVANIAVEHYLRQNDSQKAFDYAENSKARSLVDLLQGKGKWDAEKREVVFKESAAVLNLAEIQKTLPPEVQVVQYAVLEDKIAIWVFTRNRFDARIIEISGREISQKVREYLDAIKKKSLDTTRLAKELDEILIAPIAELLEKDKEICFIPDGILYYLPFASLVSKETEKYLIEDYALFYAPSTNVFVILSEKAKEKNSVGGESLLVVGNPEFSRKNEPSLRSLPSAEEEAEKISALYPNARKFVGQAARKSEILTSLAGADIFHFAGHYVANPVSALNSKLLLAENGADEFSGELRASEVLQGNFPRLKLAVLSACETGIENYYKGEGSIGMARTFLAVSTPLAVASQWKVESRSTAELMINFHRNRQGKKLTTVKALQQAQIEMLQNKEFSAPYFWAAFSATGGFAAY